MASRAELIRVGLLFGLACGLWSSVALFSAGEIATTVVPLLRWEITQLAPQYDVVDLAVVRAGGETAIALSAKAAHSRSYGGRSVPTGTALSSSTLLGHLFQPLVVMLSLVSTAALLKRRYALPMILIAIPAAVGVLMLDVPFVLAGALEDLVLANLLHPQAGESPWVIWMNFLNGGGRLALGIGAALTVVAIAPRLAASLEAHAAPSNRARRVGVGSG